MEKRVFFEHRLTPYLLVAAQLAITLIFFIWPAAQAFYQSTITQDAFGLSTTFVGLANFERLFSDSLYLHSIEITLVFSALVAALRTDASSSSVSSSSRGRTSGSVATSPRPPQLTARASGVPLRVNSNRGCRAWGHRAA